MDRDELSRDMLAHPPESGEVVYLERRGNDYAWHAATAVASTVGRDEPLPDAWIYYSGAWPADDPARWDAFFDDLLAELDTMTGQGDRCRWSPDDPWPHLH